MKRSIALLVFFLPAFTVSAQAPLPFTNDQAARAVFGQSNFTSGSAYSSQTVLGGVGGLAYANGTLWVADSNRTAAAPNNSRVLAFSTSQIPAPLAPVSGSTNSDCYLCGYPAYLSLGQSSFTPTDTTNACPLYPVPCFDVSLSQNGMRNATGVATDGVRLAVADTDNNRVLLWNSLPTQMGQNADLVLGQPNFTTGTTPTSPTATSMRGPQGVWIQNNKLFVADTQNGRVLIWNSFPTQNNQPPDLVLGQPDFNHNNTINSTSAAANLLQSPVSVTSDGTRLLVSDVGFNRVLIWNTIPTSMDQNADVVVGQADFTTATANSPNACAGFPIGNSSNTGGLAQCQTSLNFPRFALSDGTRLYVADSGNDRVMIWNTIPTTNAAPASNVLGQPDFLSDVVSSATISIASTAINNTGAVDLIPTPQSLAYDGTNLYVSDPYNRRVLVFTPGNNILAPNSIVNWASEIIRQEGLVTFTGTPTAGDTVTVTIQGTAYTYTVKKNDTLDLIAQGEVALINANSGDPNVTAFFAGTNSGTVYLSSKGSNLGYDTVTLAVTSSNTANETATASGAYLSAGTAATGAIGMLVEINGTNLSDTTESATLDGTTILPNTLGGVTVYMDGYSAPLLKVSPTQIVTQIPYYYNDRNSTSVYVRTVHNDGSVTVTAAEPVYISAANPGIFDAPAFAGQSRPWPIAQAYHQSGNPTAVVSIDGAVTAGNIATITIQGKAYSYTVAASDTLLTITQNLINLINQSDPYVTASLGGAFQRVVLTAKLPGAAGNGITVAGSVSTSATVTVSPYPSGPTTTCCVVTPGSLITTSNPAAPGELITVTAAGLGIVTDPTNTAQASLGTGVPYAGPFPNNAQSFVSATMGGSTAQVIFAELPLHSYGTYNVQLIVPTLSTNSTTPLYIAQNAFISNTVTIPVGPAVLYTGPPATQTTSTASIYTHESIDAPASGATVSGTITAFGWALNANTTVANVSVFVDGTPVGSSATYGARPDVCAVFSGPSCPNPGWTVPLNTTAFADGQHNISITVNNSDGTHQTSSQPFNISNNPSPASYYLHGSIDTPSASGIYRGVAQMQGWFTNDNSPIASVRLSVDGQYIGTTTTGLPRPDVCAVYANRPGCPNVGWSFNYDTGRIANGPHTLSASGISTNGQTLTLAQSFQVANFSTTSPVHASIDTPSAGAAAFSGSMPVGGWALDDNSAVASIGIYVDGVFYGNAAYGGTRADACSAIGNDAGCPNVGYNGQIDTTYLAEGPHTLSISVNPASGQSETFTRSFSVANQGTSANPIYGSIDFPTATTAVSGRFFAFGWALSSADAISNITLKVDGKAFGNATLGGYRNDACAVHSSPNCPNVGWSAYIDSTTLANGSHTLEITATSVSGYRASFGSTITVANSTSGPGHINIDSPAPNANPVAGFNVFTGWALNDSTAVNSVSVAIDGVSYGLALYGAPRPDACAAYPSRAGCPNVGWSFPLDTTRLIDGSHVLAITANNANGTAYTYSEQFTVANYTASNPMHLNVDSPSNQTSSAVFGTIPIFGWALDSLNTISAVFVSIDGVSIGQAGYGTGRPDVCSVFSGPGCPNVGFVTSYDTTLLPNGTHTLTIVGVSSTGQYSTFTSQFSTAN